MAILVVMHDEASDLSAAAAGDEEAFARLYDRHAGIVLSLCRRRSWSLEEAEEAAQETFLRAHRALPKVGTAQRLGGWLYATTRRVCAERRRAASRQRRREMTAASKHMADRRPPVTPAETTERAEELERLTAALEALPHKERLAIHLYYLDPDPVAAAAGALKLSRPGFYKLLARARNRLARLMCEGQPA